MYINRWFVCERTNVSCPTLAHWHTHTDGWRRTHHIHGWTTTIACLSTTLSVFFKFSWPKILSEKYNIVDIVLPFRHILMTRAWLAHLKIQQSEILFGAGENERREPNCRWLISIVSVTNFSCTKIQNKLTLRRIDDDAMTNHRISHEKKKKKYSEWHEFLALFAFDADVNWAALKIDTFEKVRQNVDKNSKMNFSWRPAGTQSTNGRIDALRQQQRIWAHHMFFAYCLLTLTNRSRIEFMSGRLSVWRTCTVRQTKSTENYIVYSWSKS